MGTPPTLLMGYGTPLANLAGKPVRTLFNTFHTEHVTGESDLVYIGKSDVTESMVTTIRSPVCGYNAI